MEPGASALSNEVEPGDLQFDMTRQLQISQFAAACSGMARLADCMDASGR